MKKPSTTFKLFVLGWMAFLLFPAILKAQVAANDHRIPVEIHDKWGYINEKGSLEIPAAFEQAKYFSDGLAAVRKNGRYGYVDANGNLVIPAKFDFAQSFYEGTAKVFIEGKPYFIDRQGNILFEHNFKEMVGIFDQSCAIAYDQTGDCGLVDRQGKLLLDTIYREIDNFSDGLAVVHPLWVDYDSLIAATSDTNIYKKCFGKGLVNLKGEFVVPMGIYGYIGRFYDGAARANPYKFDENKEIPDLVIDKQGIILNAANGLEWMEIFDIHYSDGLAIVQKLRKGEEARQPVAVDKAGQIVIDNPGFKTITPFYKGRAFAQGQDRNWRLIDRTGKIVESEEIQELPWSDVNEAPPFEEELAMVITENGWGMMNLEGKVIYPPIQKDEGHDAMRYGEWIIFSKERPRGPDNFVLRAYTYSAWNLKTNVLLEGKYDKYEILYEGCTIIRMDEGQERHYLNADGSTIWKSSSSSEQSEKPLNIDFMREISYPLPRKYEDDLSATLVTNSVSKFPGFPKGQFGISFNPASKSRESLIESSKNIVIGNDLDEPIYFQTNELGLELVMEAMDESGIWRPIEYARENTCYGPGHDWVMLRAHKAFTIEVQTYQGCIPTKMRLALRYSTDNPDKNAKTLYSEEFEGSVNPAQFWRKVPYWEQVKELGDE